MRCQSSLVKVGLEVTLAATMTRTGANMAMRKFGLIFVPKSPTL